MGQRAALTTSALLACEDTAQGEFLALRPMDSRNAQPAQVQGAGQWRSAEPGATLTLAEYELHDGSNEDHDRYAKLQFHWQRGAHSSDRLSHPAGDNTLRAAPSQRSGSSPDADSPQVCLRPGSALAADASGTWVRLAEVIAGANYEVGTRLEVKFIAIKGTQRRDGGGFVCEDGKPTVVSNTISPKFTGMREGSTIKLDAQTGLMLVEGWFATLQEEPTTEKLIEWIAGKDTNPDALYAERIEMQVRYEPNRNTMPGVASKAEDIN